MKSRPSIRFTLAAAVASIFVGQWLYADPPCDGSYPTTGLDPCSPNIPGTPNPSPNADYVGQCSNGTRPGDPTLCGNTYKVASSWPAWRCQAWDQVGPPSPFTQCGPSTSTGVCYTRWKCSFVGPPNGCEATGDAEEISVVLKENVCPQTDEQPPP